MLEALVAANIVIGLLIIILILMQKTGSDALSGLSGGSGTSLVTTKVANKFFIKVTIILATVFMINTLILANLSNRRGAENRNRIKNVVDDIQSVSENTTKQVKSNSDTSNKDMKSN